MRKKWHNWKCLLLAVFVLCTGLYVGTAKEVSAYECVPVSASGAYLMVADNTYDEAKLCTAETAGTHNQNHCQTLQNSMNYSKRVAKVSFEFLCLSCILLQKENIYIYQDKVESKIPYCQHLIANYIHKVDGEK